MKGNRGVVRERLTRRGPGPCAGKTEERGSSRKSLGLQHRSMRGTARLRGILTQDVPTGGVTSVSRMGLPWCPAVLAAWLGRGPRKLGWGGSVTGEGGWNRASLCYVPAAREPSDVFSSVATLRDQGIKRSFPVHLACLGVTLWFKSRLFGSMFHIFLTIPSRSLIWDGVELRNFRLFEFIC